MWRHHAGSSEAAPLGAQACPTKPINANAVKAPVTAEERPDCLVIAPVTRLSVLCTHREHALKAPTPVVSFHSVGLVRSHSKVHIIVKQAQHPKLNDTHKAEHKTGHTAPKITGGGGKGGANEPNSKSVWGHAVEMRPRSGLGQLLLPLLSTPRRTPVLFGDHSGNAFGGSCLFLNLFIFNFF